MVVYLVVVSVFINANNFNKIVHQIHIFSQLTRPPPLTRHDRVSVITSATVYGYIDIKSSSELLMFMLYLTRICSLIYTIHDHMFLILDSITTRT